MKSLLVLLVSLLTAGLIAQEGMQFQAGNWQFALAAARKSGQLIFVDAYTDWCGPCKLMDRDVFPLPEVGAFYNANFINLKMNMEKGEGARLRSEYQVRAYPTFLFIDGDGLLIHRSAGYQPADSFIELGRAALDPDRRLSALQQQFEAGERDPVFLYKYAFAAYEAFDGSHHPVVEAYLKTQDDWSSFRNMEFVITFAEAPDSPLFAFLIDHARPFELRYGKERVIGQVQLVINNALYEGRMDLAEADRIYRRAFPEEAARLSARFRVDYYRLNGNAEQFATAAVAYLDRYPSDDEDELNRLAWDFYQMVDDKSQLKQALAWAKRSVTIRDGFDNNDTLAALYFKLGQKKKAQAAAMHAIELARGEGVDYSDTEELLLMIEAM